MIPVIPGGVGGISGGIIEIGRIPGGFLVK